MTAPDRAALEREIAGLWQNLNEIARRVEELEAQLTETCRPGGVLRLPPRPQPPAPGADSFLEEGHGD